jgi:thimet oligopeptidase
MVTRAAASPPRARFAALFAPLLMVLAACPEASGPGPATPPDATAKSTATQVPPKGPALHEAFVAECGGHIRSARELLERVASVKDGRTVENTLEPYNKIQIHVQNALAKASLLSEVHPSPEYRAAAQKCVEDVSSLQSELNLDPRLFKAISTTDVTKADADTKRFVERTLRVFRRAGVDKDDATRKRLKDLNDQMTTVGLEFDKNIREDVRSVKLDPAQLKGLPDDYLKAHPKGADGKVTITTDYPDYLPFSRYAEDLETRKKLYFEYMNRGWPKNDQTLKKLLGLRKEYASILGYKSWADYITEDKMIKSAKNARQFIDKIAGVSQKRGKRVFGELLKRKYMDLTDATELTNWETTLFS